VRVEPRDVELVQTRRVGAARNTNEDEERCTLGQMAVSNGVPVRPVVARNRTRQLGSN
jgi:hypothetical protein